MGLGRVTSYSLTRTCIKPTNKLVSSPFKAPLVLRQATGNFGLTWLYTARTWGKPPHPPYSILCASLQHLDPNGFLSQDSQGGVRKLSWFGLPGLCKIITFCSDLLLGWGLKQTCSSLQELSNGVSHSTCTHQVGLIPNFQWSGIKLPVRLPAFFFAITCVANVQMANASPFSTSTF